MEEPARRSAWSRTCRYFTRCGGCQYQHLAYPAQLRVKQKQIADLFERVGKIRPELVAPVLPCPAPYGYRNRIMIRSQWNGPAKKLEIGFIGADNHFVEDIEECQIAEPALNEQIKRSAPIRHRNGGLKVVLRVQPEGWEVPGHSFFQNNFFLLPKLVETVRGFLQAGGARHLIDLYCGVGSSASRRRTWWKHLPAWNMTNRPSPRRGRTPQTRKVTNGEFIAAKAEDRPAGTAAGNSRRANRGAAGPAAQRLLAGTAGIAAPKAAGPGHLCLLPSGDHGAGFEHFVRAMVSLNWCACSRWTCFRRRNTSNAWRI